MDSEFWIRFRRMASGFLTPVGRRVFQHELQPRNSTTHSDHSTNRYALEVYTYILINHLFLPLSSDDDTCPLLAIRQNLFVTRSLWLQFPFYLCFFSLFFHFFPHFLPPFSYIFDQIKSLPISPPPTEIPKIQCFGPDPVGSAINLGLDLGYGSAFGTRIPDPDV